MKFPSTIRFKWAVTGTLVAAAADVVTTVAVAGTADPAQAPHTRASAHITAGGTLERSIGIASVGNVRTGVHCVH